MDEEEPMKEPTLDEFLKAAEARQAIAVRSYVRESGFKSLYVRRTRRMIGNRMVPTIDIANATARNPGHGAFTTLIARLRRDYPSLAIYAESVLSPRFATMLVDKLGFHKDPRVEQCYYLPQVSSDINE